MAWHDMTLKNTDKDILFFLHIFKKDNMKFLQVLDFILIAVCACVCI